MTANLPDRAPHARRLATLLEVARILGRPIGLRAAFAAVLQKLAKGADNTWAYTGGLNWYLNKNFKVQFNYERSNFSQPITFSGNTVKHEDVLLARFQLQF